MSINLLPSEEKIKYRKPSETAPTIEMIGLSSKAKAQPGVKRSGVLMFFKKAFARPKKTESDADKRLPEKKVFVEEKVFIEKEKPRAKPQPVIQYTAAKPESLQVKSGKSFGEKASGFFSGIFKPRQKNIPTGPVKAAAPSMAEDKFPKYKAVRAEKIFQEKPISHRPAEVVRVQTKEFVPTEKPLPQAVMPQKYINIPREGFPKAEPQFKIKKETVLTAPALSVKKSAWQNFIGWLRSIFGVGRKKTKLVSLPPMEASLPEKPPSPPEPVVLRAARPTFTQVSAPPYRQPASPRQTEQKNIVPPPPAKLTAPPPPPPPEKKVAVTPAQPVIKAAVPLRPAYDPNAFKMPTPPVAPFKNLDDKKHDEPTASELTVKTGLWKKIINFFTGLFRKKIQPETVEDIKDESQSKGKGGVSLAASFPDDNSRTALDWEVNLIPEEIMEKEIPAGKILLLALVLIISVGLVFGGWLGANYYYSNISRQISEINGEISTVKTEVSSYKKMQSDVDALNAKISDVRTLLDKHVYWAGIFQGLEAYTLPDVYYSSMTADVSGKVVLAGSAKNYEIAVKQLYVFQRATDLVSNVTMSGITFVKAAAAAGATNANAATTVAPSNNTEAVNFNLDLTVLPSIFYKMR